jgi:hypothetical protein
MSKLPDQDTIANAMYEAAARSRSTEARRNYLGMSSIGEPCERKLWYSFRGFTGLPFEGRTIMIFRFGDRVEEEVIHHLRLAGYQVEGQQDAYTDHDGWFSGHCDGIIHGITSRPHILEIKSCNDKKFKAFKDYGVHKTSETYWAQVQCYMGYAQLERALFVIQNKNDSSIYTERVYFDAEAFQSLKNKAFRIITANEMPIKQFTTEAMNCKWCDHRVSCWSPGEAIQTSMDCMNCKYLEWVNRLKRVCWNGKHPYEIIQRSGVCPDWEEI